MSNDKIYFITGEKGLIFAATTDKHKAFSLLRQVKEKCKDNHIRMLRAVDGELYYKE